MYTLRPKIEDIKITFKPLYGCCGLAWIKKRRWKRFTFLYPSKIELNTCFSHSSCGLHSRRVETVLWHEIVHLILFEIDGHTAYSQWDNIADDIEEYISEEQT